MNLSRVDLNLFVVFEAIFTLGSITAAGRKLNLSQSAVSHALARLRGLFDDQLFERSSRGMEPTPLARALIGDVRLALQSMEGTLKRTLHFDPSTTRRSFNVAMGDPFDSLLLPPLLERIGPLAPGIDIATQHSDRRKVEPAMLEGSLDLAVDVLLQMPPTIDHVQVLSQPMVVVARKDHPEIQGKVDLDAYLGQEHIRVSSRRRGFSVEDIALRRRGLTRHVRLRCEHYAAACRVVSRTDMLATMPFSFASLANDEVQNQLLPAPFSMPHLELYLYWHTGSDSDAACRWLREQIAATMAAVQGLGVRSAPASSA